MNKDEEEDISYLYNEFDKLTDGYDYNTVMVAIAAFYADLIKEVTSGDKERIRELYAMMADAAIQLCSHHDSDHEFQAQEDTPQKEEAEESRQEARDESDSSRAD